jgi:Rrf2 family protein
MKLGLRPRTELTLRIVTVLGEGGRWRAGDLAQAVDTTPAYIAHVLAPLTRAGWVHSSPGPTGGHELVVDIADVSLLDLIEAVEGPTDDGTCVMSRRPCPGPQICALHHTWTRARDAMTSELAATSLRSIIPSQETSR